MGQASCHCEHPARDDCSVFVPQFDRKLREVCWAGPNPHEELAVYPNPGSHVGGGSHFPMILARRAIFERGRDRSPNRSSSSGFGRRDSVEELQYRSFDPHFEIVRSLARGSFAEVYEVTPRRAPNSCTFSSSPSCGAAKEAPKSQRVLAAKKFARTLGEATPTAGKIRADLRQECLIYNSLEHPHLLKMFESFKGEDCDWTLIELCAGGDLFGRILALSKERGSEGGAYDEPTGRLLTRQMLSALCFLHDYFIVHCDVKPENFLVVGPPGTQHDCYLKLCDFGSAVCLSDEKPRAMTTTCTLSYTPPEVYARRGCSLLGDCWSLGVVIYAILVGLNPFRSQDDTKERVLRRIMTGNMNKTRPAWKRLSEPVQALIGSLLVVDEGSRASCQEITSDPWILDVTEDDGSRFLHPLSVEKESILAYAGVGQALVNAILWFAQLDPLQRFVCWLCGQQLPDERVVDAMRPIPWYKLFFALDQRQDGLDSRDLSTAVATWGLEGEEVQTSLSFAFDLLDQDGSGIIEWGEWMALAISATPDLLGDWEVVDVVYRLLDVQSGDGLIGEEDLMRFFRGYSRDRIDDLLRPWATGSRPSTTRLSSTKYPEISEGFGREEEEIVDAVEAEGSHEITRFEQKKGGLTLTAADVRKLLRAALEMCGDRAGSSPRFEPAGLPEPQVEPLIGGPKQLCSRSRRLPGCKASLDESQSESERNKEAEKPESVDLPAPEKPVDGPEAKTEPTDNVGAESNKQGLEVHKLLIPAAIKEDLHQNHDWMIDVTPL